MKFITDDDIKYANMLLDDNNEAALFIIPILQQVEDWAEQNRFYSKWSRLWKRAAKKWRDKYQEVFFETMILTRGYKQKQATANRLRGLLREGLEATKRADGHWSDRVRWMNWVEKAEKELADDSLGT